MLLIEEKDEIEKEQYYLDRAAKEGFD